MEYLECFRERTGINLELQAMVERPKALPILLLGQQKIFWRRQEDGVLEEARRRAQKAWRILAAIAWLGGIGLFFMFARAGY